VKKELTLVSENREAIPILKVHCKPNTYMKNAREATAPHACTARGILSGVFSTVASMMIHQPLKN